MINKTLNFFNYFFLKKKVVLVEENQGLAQLVRSLNEIQIIGIDTEFEWRNTYFPIPSLIQISTLKQIFLIDCQKLEILDELIEILQNNEILVIFHSARSDTTLLSKAIGIEIKNAFDIQVAEKFLSNGENLSYAKIVYKYFGVKLNKSETNSRWLIRPLTEKQLDYAAKDAQYLIEIFKKQSKLLKKENLLDEVFNLSRKEASLGNQSLSISRLKKYANKTLKEKRLASWREKKSEQLNIPPSHLFSDKNIKKILSSIEGSDINYLNQLFGNETFSSELLNEIGK